MNYYNYFTEIEDTFVRRRGKSLLLSPIDWALMESWQERDVPLHIILRAIESVFDTYDKSPNRKRTVKGLSYCKEEIEAQYAEWLEAQIGKTGETSGTEVAGGDLFSRDSVQTHLKEAADALRQAAAETKSAELREEFERVCVRLEALANVSESPEKLEESLEKLDELIDQALLAHFDIADVTNDTENNLSGYRGKMEPDAFQRTFDLMILKKLRERAEIPRLSLFYL